MQKALWSFLTDLCHEILEGVGGAGLGSFTQPKNADQEYKVLVYFVFFNRKLWKSLYRANVVVGFNDSFIH